MKLLARLEARFGRYAIPNLTLVLIVGQAFIYFADWFRTAQGGDSVIGRIAFVPAKVLEGEVWRVVTFLFAPPNTRVVLLTLVFWMVFHLIGSALEHQWGAFRFNAFIFVGAAATMTAAFLIPQMAADNFFLYNTVFLAFAFLYPDFVFHLFFILPIKVKWLALIDWLLLGMVFVNSVISAHWSGCIITLASVANFFLFFGQDIRRRLHDKQRRAAFESRTREAKKKSKYRHKCVVCGITNVDDPKMQFRYCSKCNGQPCYCMEHIHNHDHIVNE